MSWNSKTSLQHLLLSATANPPSQYQECRRNGGHVVSSQPVWQALRTLQQQHSHEGEWQHSPQKRMKAWLVPSMQWPFGMVMFSRVVGQPNSPWL